MLVCKMPELLDTSNTSNVSHTLANWKLFFHGFDGKSKLYITGMLEPVCAKHLTSVRLLHYKVQERGAGYSAVLL